MSSTDVREADLVVIAKGVEAVEPVEDELGTLATLGRTVTLMAGDGAAPAHLAHLPFRQEPALAPSADLTRGVARLFGRRARVARRLLAGTEPGSVLLVLSDCLASLVRGADRSADMTIYVGADAREELTRRRDLAEQAELGAIERLVRSGRHDRARRLILRYRTVSAVAGATAAAWGAAMDLTEAGGGTIPESVVADAIGAADRAWSAGRIVSATYALGAAMRVLFHPTLHADIPDPPLAHHPAEFLRPIETSSMLQDVLGQPADPAELEGHAGERRPQATPTDILVLTGSYPRFSAPLVAALEDMQGSTVSVLAPGTLDKRFNWLGMNTDALAWRVSAHPRGQGAGSIAGPPERHAAVLDGYDTIIADWADRGAMWASLMCPPGTRLIVRMHGMDLFSPWVHLIDWSRVDDLIFVSAPLRELGQSILGARLEGVRIHTVEHGIDSARFTVPQSPDANRTLGMIGWGKLVKDPAWTLDVLEELVATDPSWRLLLIGHELPKDGGERARAYAGAFWARLDGPLGDHVELVPQTEEIPTQAARLGFILSSSRRESFHLAVVEGVLAGAVPVVRDWPVYQHTKGPRAIFPPEWVVTDAAGAVGRIQRLSEPGTFREAAQRAHLEAVQRYNPQVFGRRLRAVLSGSAHDPGGDSAS